MARVQFNELSSEEVYALMYALAVVSPEAWEARFKAMDAKADAEAVRLGMYVFAPSAKKELIRRGLQRLWERGLIELARDGTGEAVPAVVHLDRLELTGSLILSEGN